MGCDKWIHIGDDVYVNPETRYNLSGLEPEEELTEIIIKEILDDYQNSKRPDRTIEGLTT